MHREHWGWDWPGEDGKEVLEVGAGRAAWLEWVGLHGWCGKGCIAGVGRGFIISVGRAAWLEWVEASLQVWVGLYGMTGTVNYMTYDNVVEI